MSRAPICSAHKNWCRQAADQQFRITKKQKPPPNGREWWIDRGAVAAAAGGGPWAGGTRPPQDLSRRSSHPLVGLPARVYYSGLRRIATVEAGHGKIDDQHPPRRRAT